MDDDERSDDSQEQPQIKVTDRRKFAADGTLRAGDPADADADPADADVDPADDTSPGEAAAHGEPDAPEPTPGNEENAARAEAPPTVGPGEDDPLIAAPQASIADLPRDFAAFVEGMYLEAMLYLGVMPDPRSGQVMEDIELAQYKIDLLAMIQAKTQGNLTADEKKQLDEVLYQLRTAFLQRTATSDS
jgi:hypothetical protein